MNLLLKGGKVIDPEQEKEYSSDILIIPPYISKIFKDIKAPTDAKIVNLKGKLIFPGFIDMHTHLREPGFEYKETIESGLMSAASGGFTTISCMPNTNPPIDKRSVVDFIKEKSKSLKKGDVLPIGCITKGREGKELSEMGELAEAGVCAFSDDGNCVQNSEVMRRAMEYSLIFNLPIISHCEDESLSKGGQINEGYISTLLGLKGICSAAEETMVFRDIILSKLTNATLHIAHISSSTSLDLVRQAKKQGLKVTCEVTPHHLLLYDEFLTTFDTNYKVNPPLRTKQEVKKLIEGLKDGTIDVIATDHAPHADFEKEMEFNNAPFGIIGLETTVPLIYTYFVKKGILSNIEFAKKLSLNPARILKIKDGGMIKENLPANLTIIDPDFEDKITLKNIYSKSKNTPFIGWKVSARVLYTICKGKIIYSSEDSY